MVKDRRAQPVSDAGEYAEDHPAERRGQRHRQRRAEGGGSAGQQPAEDVAPEIVGAEKERHVAVARPGRRQQLIAEELLIQRVGRQQATEQRQQQQGDHAVKPIIASASP